MDRMSRKSNLIFTTNKNHSSFPLFLSVIKYIVFNTNIFIVLSKKMVYKYESSIKTYVKFYNKHLWYEL